MSNTIIRVENVSKQYRLGQITTGTLSHDLNRFWHTIRGKDDPYLKIGEGNDRTRRGGTEYVWALRDIDFDVQRGEVIGVIGRNGAGKSTLLKLLSRTTLPTTGSIKAKGRIASLLEVGTGFHPELSGRENIFLNGAILGMMKSEIASRFDEIVDFAGVEKYIDTPVKRYSSGMYVRLAFAVAAHLEPDILIVDEVLAVGDAEFQKKCLGKMQDVSKSQGRTVLFVSHNMVAIQSLCQHAILLNEGRIHSHTDSLTAIETYLYLNKNHTDESSLSLRKDRQGDGRLRFAGVQLLDVKTGKEIQGASSGDDLIIRLLLQKNTSVKINKLLIALGINDGLDNRICHISTELTNQSFDKLPEELDHVDITIKRLPLNTGTYNFALYAAINDEVSDWVQNAYYFKIEEGDFYKTGKTISSSAGTFLVDYKFIF